MRNEPKKVAILGFGLEGRALFPYIRKERLGYEVTILDENPKTTTPAGVKKVLGKRYLNNLERFDIVFRSQGVPCHLPQIQKVKSKISSLTNIFFENAKGKIIGVTGSAGKTTAATLLYNILRAAGKQVFLGGNIGKNPLEFLPKLNKRFVTVMELSSFQLEDVRKSPYIAVVLDVYREHLDKHKNLKEYIAAKANIARFQKASDYIIFSKDSLFSRNIASQSRARKLSFSLTDTSADMYVRDGAILSKANGKMLSLSDIKIPGAHNVKNMMAALLAARAVGVGQEIARKTAMRFRGLPHRLEFLGRIRGIKFYNDSGAVNIGAALASMDAFSENKVVLVGGQNKNLPLRPLADRLMKPDVKFIGIFGTMRNELTSLLSKRGLKNFVVKLKMLDAAGAAIKKAEPGGIVLLAPGTASFDEFRDYRERGAVFKKFVKSLK